MIRIGANAVAANANVTPTDTDKGRWTSIFSYLHFNEHERLSVRSLCSLFHTVLKGPTCAGEYTMFPHNDYLSLNSLMDRLDELYAQGTHVKYLFIANGKHLVTPNIIYIHTPISIIGESREHCIVMGGLMMRGKKEDDVNVSNLTLRDSKDHGVFGYNGASFHLDNVSVENSAYNGVWVHGSKRNTMNNCNVSDSKHSGLLVEDGGLMTIYGKDTTIHHNCTSGSSGYYGLEVNSSSCSIHLVSPLTKEMISTNNHGGHNYCGTIQTITNNNTKEEKK